MIVAPGHNMVLPLTSKFITPQDGAEKQDCERNAAKRWLIAHGDPFKLGKAIVKIANMERPMKLLLPERTHSASSLR